MCGAEYQDKESKEVVISNDLVRMTGDAKGVKELSITGVSISKEDALELVQMFNEAILDLNRQWGEIDLAKLHASTLECKITPDMVGRTLKDAYFSAMARSQNKVVSVGMSKNGRLQVHMEPHRYSKITISGLPLAANELTRLENAMLDAWEQVAAKWRKAFPTLSCPVKAKKSEKN